MAHVIEIPEMGMNADQRCDRCGAQAYVAVEMPDVESDALLFCAHHGTEHMPKFLTMAVTIVDHRPFLKKQEHEPQPA